MLRSERGEVSITLLAIALAAILMFVFPLMTMADKKDDVTALAVQKLTDEFVDTIRTTGTLSQAQYDNYMQQLVATGNSYNVDITIKVSDDNPAKKEVSVNYKTTGETVYYEMYTKQVLDALKNGEILKLNEGDFIYVTAKNSNQTIAMTLRDFIYKLTGKPSESITASAGGMATKNGN